MRPLYALCLSGRPTQFNNVPSIAQLVNMCPDVCNQGCEMACARVVLPFLKREIHHRFGIAENKNVELLPNEGGTV